MAPLVTVCIPVYNRAGFIEKTLQAIQSQTFTDFCVLISVDQGQDELAAVCQAFTEDARFTVFEQPAHLGWVGNINLLIEQVQTEYFSIVCQDDRPEPGFLRRSYEYLKQFPDAAAVYCDIKYFGFQTHSMIQESFTGNKLDRVLQLLGSGFSSAVQGMFRHSVVAGLRMRDNAHRGFGAEAVWKLQVACRGTLHRLPETRYLKWIDPSTEHQGWKVWQRERLIAAWVQHCRDCAQVVLAEDFPPVDRQLLLFACLNRTLRMTQSIESFLENHELLPVEQSMLISLWMSQVLGTVSLPTESPFALYDRPEAAPILAEFYGRAAKNAVNSGQAAEAERLIQRALAIDSTIAEFHETLASVQAQQNHLEAAIATQKTVLSLTPCKPYALSRLGELYAQNQQLALAEASYRQAIALEKSGYYFNGLSYVLAAQGQLEAALEAVKTAVDLLPQEPYCWANLGNMYAQLNQLEAATAALQQAIQLNPGIAYVYTTLSQVLARTEQLEAAIAAGKIVIELDPDLHCAWGHLGNLYSQTQQWEAAANCFQTAIQLEESNGNYYHGLGWALASQGQMEAAIAAEKIAVELDPSLHYAWGNLGNLYSQMQQWEAAAHSFQMAIQLEKNNGNYHHGLGWALASQGQMEAAIAAEKTAVELDPSLHYAWGNLGSLYNQTQQWEAAAHCFQTVIELDSNNGHYYHGLSWALASQGQVEAAIAAEEIALELIPDQPDFQGYWEYLQTRKLTHY
jgi:tetratricopeptide (TPR) repeat protein